MGERRHDDGQGMPHSTDKVDGWLASARGPALVIAPGEARLIGANPAAAKLLGLTEKTEWPVSLDSAMPAIMDLRRIISRAGRASQPAMALVFWTPHGIARLRCHVEVVAEYEGNQRLALVEVASQAAPAMREPSLRDVGTEPSAPPSEQLAHYEAPAAQRAALPPTEPANTTPPQHAAPETEAARQNPQSATGARRACEPNIPQSPAPLPATVSKAHERTSRRPYPAAARPAMPPPAPAPPLPPPPTRSDDDTLKAIARQILAGRRGTTPNAERTTNKPTQTSARPNGTVRPDTRDTKSAAPGSIAASRHTPSNDVRRTAPGAVPSVKHMRTKSKSQPIAAGRAAPAAAPPLPQPQSFATDLPTATPPAGHTGDDLERTGSTSTRLTRARRVAHELKTPLSAIVSAAEIMKDQRLGSIGDDRYLRYAQDIYESARHALAVIERMLGQPHKNLKDPTQAELSFTNLDLNALAAGLLSGLEMMAQEAGLSLTSDLAPRLPLVVADATSIRQILLNLITNALKFTPRGGQVQLSTRIDETGRLLLSVADTGPGMSPEALARLAETGVAHDMSGVPQRRPGGGLGIGLPLAQRLASANGATLEISARTGGGTLVALAFHPSRQVPI